MKKAQLNIKGRPTLRQIQDDVVRRYKVTLDEHSTCYGRTHAHVRERRVCKWHPRNSIQSTFTLLHEIGHIETTTSKMRRCESEYHATNWAIDRCKEYGLKIPKKTLEQYQEYIFRELDRGLRRGGRNYPTREELLLPDLDEYRDIIKQVDTSQPEDLSKRPHLIRNVTWTNCLEMESVIDELVADISRGKVVTLLSTTMTDEDCEWIQECVASGLRLTEDQVLEGQTYHPNADCIRMKMWMW